MSFCTPARILASAVAAVCATAFAAPPSLAQTAPTPDIQVLEFDYAPAAAQQGLDLRPGRYLLQLQRDASGRFEGRLRGPSNEFLAESLELAGGPSCAAGLGSDAVLNAQARAGQTGLNVLRLEIRSGSSGCSLQGALAALELAAPRKPPEELECAPPEEVSLSEQTDNDPACAPPPPQLPLTARPEMRPGAKPRIGGIAADWTRVLSLPAARALATQNGRCFFDYAFVIENVGWATSGPTDTSVLLERRLGLQLDRQPLPALAPGGRHVVTGVLGLPAGLWRVFVHADSRGRVGEYDALNNARSVLVNVSGDCSGL
ncbi:hypothetical protein [Aquimonas voraii]|uniref:CARDB protein n=1 Tax=Aquimonas voraii TaxID=265719 RepID=A0A1G6T839_9GAMM|nr:hypothetical protein [Aquimonas voraii]SDD25034.1 hypothetical protein SAMN04488509_101921 [Aquimonas voraii]